MLSMLRSRKMKSSSSDITGNLSTASIEQQQQQKQQQINNNLSKVNGSKVIKGHQTQQLNTANQFDTKHSSTMSCATSDDSCAINELLEGRMDLIVNLPKAVEVNKIQLNKVTINVERRQPMMDLLVNIATQFKLNAANYKITTNGHDFKANTPIGSLDVKEISIVPKTSNTIKRLSTSNLNLSQIPSPTSSTSAVTPSTPTYNQIPFQTTFRLQVNLPRNQLMVFRVSPTSTISQVKQIVCNEKGLDQSKYELVVCGEREPQILNTERTLAFYAINEITLMSKKAIMESQLQYSNATSSATDCSPTAETLPCEPKKVILSLLSATNHIVPQEMERKEPEEKERRLSLNKPLKKRPAPLPPASSPQNRDSIIKEIDGKVETSSTEIKRSSVTNSKQTNLGGHRRQNSESDSSGYHESMLSADSPELPITTTSSSRASMGKLTARIDESDEPLSLNQTSSSSLSAIPSLKCQKTNKKRKAPAPPPPSMKPVSSSSPLPPSSVMSKQAIDEMNVSSECLSDVSLPISSSTSSESESAISVPHLCDYNELNSGNRHRYNDMQIIAEINDEHNRPASATKHGCLDTKDELVEENSVGVDRVNASVSIDDVSDAEKESDIEHNRMNDDNDIDSKLDENADDSKCSNESNEQLNMIKTYNKQEIEAENESENKMINDGVKSSQSSPTMKFAEDQVDCVCEKRASSNSNSDYDRNGDDGEDNDDKETANADDKLNDNLANVNTSENSQFNDVTIVDEENNDEENDDDEQQDDKTDDKDGNDQQNGKGNTAETSTSRLQEEEKAGEAGDDSDNDDDEEENVRRNSEEEIMSKAEAVGVNDDINLNDSSLVMEERDQINVDKVNLSISESLVRTKQTSTLSTPSKSSITSRTTTTVTKTSSVISVTTEDKQQSVDEKRCGKKSINDKLETNLPEHKLQQDQQHRHHHQQRQHQQAAKMNSSGNKKSTTCLQINAENKSTYILVKDETDNRCNQNDSNLTRSANDGLSESSPSMFVNNSTPLSRPKRLINFTIGSYKNDDEHDIYRQADSNRVECGRIPVNSLQQSKSQSSVVANSSNVNDLKQSNSFRVQTDLFKANTIERSNSNVMKSRSISQIEINKDSTTVSIRKTPSPIEKCEASGKGQNAGSSKSIVNNVSRQLVNSVQINKSPMVTVQTITKPRGDFDAIVDKREDKCVIKQLSPSKTANEVKPQMIRVVQEPIKTPPSSSFNSPIEKCSKADTFIRRNSSNNETINRIQITKSASMSVVAPPPPPPPPPFPNTANKIGNLTGPAKALRSDEPVNRTPVRKNEVKSVPNFNRSTSCDLNSRKYDQHEALLNEIKNLNGRPSLKKVKTHSPWQLNMNKV